MDWLLEAIFASLVSMTKSLAQEVTPSPQCFTASEHRKQHLWTWITNNKSLIKSVSLSKISVQKASSSTK